MHRFAPGSRSDTASSNRVGSGRRVLLVDDDEALLELLARQLEADDYDVACAKNGEDALGLLKESAPDVVVMDVVMPETDGIELLLSIRKQHPATKAVVMSGGSPRHYLDPDTLLSTARHLGAIEVLQKPFRARELTSILATLLA